MQSSPKWKWWLVGAVIVVVAVVIIAYLVQNPAPPGSQQGAQESAAEKLAREYPAPTPTTVLTGTVTDVASGMVAFTTNDPTDYLPHSDGTPNRTLNRVALVGKSTKLQTLLMSKTDAAGTPTAQSLSLSNLKAGDTVRVSAGSDILNETRIAATEVDKLVY